LVGGAIVALVGIAGVEHYARRLTQGQLAQAVESRQQLERRLNDVLASHERLEANLVSERRRSNELESALTTAQAQIEQTNGRLAQEGRNSRSLQMRVTEMQQQLDQLQGELSVALQGRDGALAGLKPGTVQIDRVVVSDATAPTGSGRVISIHRDWDFVVINMGWDAVRIGDIVSIYRDEQLRAKARVERVQEGVCAATVLPDWKTDAVALNDVARVL
jgi:hypothetical protein